MPSSNTIQDIFQSFNEEFTQNHPLPAHKLKTLNDISNCRTGYFGGTLRKCDNCNHTEVLLHSCQNRHCPICQASNQAKWCENQLEHTLPVQYFHVVFTLPSELNPLVFSNQKILYTVFFKAASQSILELCADKKYLGAMPGLIGVLHTWGQNLQFHPHIHFIVTGGGLSDTGVSFVRSGKKFFLPVKVLSRKFRGKFLSMLKDCFSDNSIYFSNICANLKDYNKQKVFFNNLYLLEWVVYSKKAFKSPDYVIRYLGRYTHRVAISNSRIVSVDKVAKTVTYKWKDYRDNNKQKLMTLSAVEFIRRFSLHILPPVYRKIRQYGLLSNRIRSKRIAACRKILNAPSRPDIKADPDGHNTCVCSKCSGNMLTYRLSGLEATALSRAVLSP